MQIKENDVPKEVYSQLNNIYDQGTVSCGGFVRASKESMPIEVKKPLSPPTANVSKMEKHKV